MNLITTIGCELEMENLRNVAADVSYIRGKLEPRFPHWVVKTDGSCGRTGCGVELNSPILRTTQDLDGIVGVCTLMDALSYKVTPKCGLHIHVDVRNLTPAQTETFTRFFVQFEEIFFALAPGRKSVSYCKPLTPEVLTRLRSGMSWSSWHNRYFWLNGRAFDEHGTAEFRLMSGSLNPLHVVGWASFLLHVYELVVTGKLTNAVLLNFHHAVGEVKDLYEQLLALTGLSSGVETQQSEAASTWLKARWVDTQCDVVALRAERRRRLHAAWKGEAVYVPIKLPAGIGKTL